MDASEYWAKECEFKNQELFHRLEVQNQLGQAALKNMMLANGGSIVALLTFAGNKGKIVDPAMLKCGMACFGIGLFVGLLAYFFAYFSQAEFMHVAHYRLDSAQSQMKGDEPKQMSVAHDIRGTRFLWTAIVMLILSLLSFGFGALFTLHSIF